MHVTTALVHTVEGSNCRVVECRQVTSAVYVILAEAGVGCTIQELSSKDCTVI
jgi:hypothetical protein